MTTDDSAEDGLSKAWKDIHRDMLQLKVMIAVTFVMVLVLLVMAPC